MELSAAQVPLNSGTMNAFGRELTWHGPHQWFFGGRGIHHFDIQHAPTIFNKKACVPLLCGSNDDTVLTKAMVDHVYPPVLNMVGTKIRL